MGLLANEPAIPLQAVQQFGDFQQGTLISWCEGVVGSIPNITTHLRTVRNGVCLPAHTRPARGRWYKNTERAATKPDTQGGVWQ